MDTYHDWLLFSTLASDMVTIIDALWKFYFCNVLSHVRSVINKMDQGQISIIASDVAS